MKTIQERMLSLAYQALKEWDCISKEGSIVLMRKDRYMLRLKLYSIPCALDITLTESASEIYRYTQKLSKEDFEKIKAEFSNRSSQQVEDALKYLGF